MEDRLKVLEDELTTVRGELGSLKREMAAMEAKARERESQAPLERDEARKLLSGSTNLDERDQGAPGSHELNSRLSALPNSTPILGPPSDPPTDRQDVASLNSVRIASQHARDILDTVKTGSEQEGTYQERDQLLARPVADPAQIEEDTEARIKALGDELEVVRVELENEKQQKATAEAETRERESQAFLERDEAIRNQLGDITNLVQDQRDTYDRQKEIGDARWEEKQSRRQAKDNRWTELQDIVRKIQDDVEVVRNQAEEARIERETKPGIENVIEELQRQNAEQRELLNALSESWRADGTRQHQETIDTVRSTAQEQVPFNVQGYLDEFSKALASDVRILLGEVGKLREERRALQHESGYLLSMKSKYGPGGDFEPDWKPSPGALNGLPPSKPPEPPASLPADPPQVKPAWRIIPSRIRKKTNTTAPAPPPPPDAPSEEDPRHQRKWWENWQTDFELTVGKLREERRVLQFEIGSLLTTRAKFGAGGEFDPEWNPPPGTPDSSPAPSVKPERFPPEFPPGVVLDWGKIQPKTTQKTKEAAFWRTPPFGAIDKLPPPPEPSLPPDLASQAKPAWRTVHPRIRKKKKRPAPPVPDPPSQIQTWATWQPDPQFAPSPQHTPGNLVVPEQSSPGLFGPRSPAGSMYEGR